MTAPASYGASVGIVELEPSEGTSWGINKLRKACCWRGGEEQAYQGTSLIVLVFLGREWEQILLRASAK